MGSEESEQGAFNFALEYLKTLMIIERNIIDAFTRQDFESAGGLLDMYWLELAEWFKPEEHTEHSVLRKAQNKASSEITRLRINGKKSLPAELVEAYYDRFRMLNTIIHRKGLRMPKKDDPAFALGGRNY